MNNHRRHDPLYEMSIRQGSHITQQQEVILERLARVQWKDGLSDKKMGGIIGISPATISLLKSGSYRGDHDKYLGLLKQWLDEREKGEKKPHALYIPTTIGENIRMVCTMAVQKPCIGIVKTPSGWGKTAALQEVGKQISPRGCYIQAGEASAYKRDMLYTLCQAIGVPYVSATARVYSELGKKLAEFYGGGSANPYLIIIDEATTLKHATINMLRNLHDDVNCRTAIVFADTVSRLDGFLYGCNSQAIAGGNEQLRSRGNAQCVVDATQTLPEKDIVTIAQSSIKITGARKKLNAGAVKYLVNLAAKPGALRNVVSRVENVTFYAKEKNVTAEYNAAQLDYVGILSGDSWTMKHTKSPFGNAATATQKSLRAR
ncbi:MAG: ATP-binding protein [Phycisphaerae bacterium]|nr:ATP-binding protein [Phycisphaerae bacterium]